MSIEQSRRTRLASAGIIAAVFVSGGLVGMAIDRSLLAGPGDDAVPVGPEAGPQDDLPQEARSGERGNRPASRNLYEQVGLSAEARLIADSIVRDGLAKRREFEQDYRRDMDSLRAASGGDARSQQFRRDVDGLIAQMRLDIKSVMTAQQVASYDSLLAGAEAKRRADEQRRRGNRENAPPPDHR